MLFLVFNRPDTTYQVFEAIRRAKPQFLYVAADGPREGVEGEAQLVAKVRKIASLVDWPCELKTLFREKNLGCKRAVSGAITWFFEQVEQGIILEDDCLPHGDFFHFCEILLDRYADDGRVSVITGNNFQNGRKRGDGSYYFSRYNHVWGWASWRRAWQHYDGDLRFWPNWKRSGAWLSEFPDRVERRYWEGIFDQMYDKQIDTWDYPWTASIWYHAGLTATPNVNLVSNIGFGPDATHTTSAYSPLALMATTAIGGLVHPAFIAQDRSADRYVFDCTFGGKQKRFPWLLLYLPRRIAGFIYHRLKRSFSSCR